MMDYPSITAHQVKLGACPIGAASGFQLDAVNKLNRCTRREESDNAPIVTRGERTGPETVNLPEDTSCLQCSHMPTGDMRKYHSLAGAILRGVMALTAAAHGLADHCLDDSAILAEFDPLDRSRAGADPSQSPL